MSACVGPARRQPGSDREWPELGRLTLLGASVGPGLRLDQHLPDLTPRMMERAGNGSNAHAVSICSSNFFVIFHRQHPCLLSAGATAQYRYQPRRLLRWVQITRRFPSRGGSVFHADYQQRNAKRFGAHGCISLLTQFPSHILLETVFDGLTVVCFARYSADPGVRHRQRVPAHPQTPAPRQAPGKLRRFYTPP